MKKKNSNTNNFIMIYKKREKSRVGKITKNIPRNGDGAHKANQVEEWMMMGKNSKFKKSLEAWQWEIGILLKYAFTLHIFSPLLVLEGNWRNPHPHLHLTR